MSGASGPRGGPARSHASAKPAAPRAASAISGIAAAAGNGTINTTTSHARQTTARLRKSFSLLHSCFHIGRTHSFPRTPTVAGAVGARTRKVQALARGAATAWDVPRDRVVGVERRAD